MSWLPRVPSLGRFSPFSGTPRQGPSSPAARVTDDHFSYITDEDLNANTPTNTTAPSAPHTHHSHHHHHHSSHHDHHAEPDPRHSAPNILHKTPSYPTAPSSAHLAPVSSTSRARSHSRSRSQVRESPKPDRPPRETDILHFRHQGQTLPVHFPAYALDDGIVTAGSAREHAARRLNVDPGRVRMFVRGKNLRDDAVALRDVGVRSADKTEIMVVVGTGSGSSSESESEDDASSAAGGTSRRKKRRGGGGSSSKKRSSKKKSSTSTSADNAGYVGSAAPSEHLPLPASHTLPSHSPASSRQPSPGPSTPHAKLQALEDKFRELLPMAKNLLADPPAEKEKRDYEYKKVTETIMTQVLLKIDGVETEGDEEARARRKALVKEVQGWLSRVDEVVKG